MIRWSIYLFLLIGINPIIHRQMTQYGRRQEATEGDLSNRSNNMNTIQPFLLCNFYVNCFRFMLGPHNGYNLKTFLEIDYALIHSFVHSFFFTHPFIHAFIYEFICEFIHSLIHSFFIHSPINSCIHSFIHSITHSFIHSFIHSCIHSSINSFLRLLIHSFAF